MNPTTKNPTTKNLEQVVVNAIAKWLIEPVEQRRRVSVERNSDGVVYDLSDGYCASRVTIE